MKEKDIYQESLEMHESGQAGKFEITLTKALNTQKDLSLAYSPGVAEPVRKIAQHASNAYRYTGKGNFVAVISNGTAILGLGALGSLASKPVMEGKAVLFKKFGGVDAIDLEFDTLDVDEFVRTVEIISGTFGGINLEDIKAPECFEIERRLQETVDIPVFHDDQHGTAIVTTAGLISALDLVNKKIEDIKIVVSGAGAAAIACIELMKTMGIKDENVRMCDSKGVLYIGRPESMNQYKIKHAVETTDRTLADAIIGADVFLGLSQPNVLTAEMLKAMARDPIVFACANPDPEIKPELAKATRDDVIMATGRSDYPNQVNNVLCFPYLFRGALDVRATKINAEMKVAAVKALAALAKEPVPEEVKKGYGKTEMSYGREYILPTPMDPRLKEFVGKAVAKAAIESGVAQICKM
ncbi:MAG: malate dehydrogenase [Alphaproteobacteria bacterium]|nr:malate dehydrogenase [Alphaproteobacteria bacterium]MBN2779905.1 malate dehydrogenase [Alphaproteobacteria bacterium]